MKSKFRTTGVVICLSLMVIPLIFMPFKMKDGSSKYRNEIEFPSLFLADEGRLNFDFPAQFEAWYQDHFALRQPLIALNSWVNLRAFHTSQIKDVIVGRSGMLFYRPTTPDFEDSAPLSTEELKIIKENLQLMQTTLASQGAKLYIAIAPNKNTIYPENMPTAFQFRKGGGNQDRLYEALSGTEIHTIDLRAPLLEAKKSKEVYYLTDTHWNRNGAVAAVEALLFQLNGKTYDEVPRPNRTVAYTEGDLARMLGLETILTEPAADYSDLRVYDKGINYLHHNFMLRGEGEGKICLFRDSFATAIGPLLHKYFAETTFRWEIPFDITEIGKVDAVLILLVERNIRDLMEPPLCPR